MSYKKGPALGALPLNRAIDEVGRPTTALSQDPTMNTPQKTPALDANDHWVIKVPKWVGRELLRAILYIGGSQVVAHLLPLLFGR